MCQRLKVLYVLTFTVLLLLALPTAAATTSLTSPTSGATAVSPFSVFTWNTIGADAYYLQIGSQASTADVYSSGALSGSVTSIRPWGLLPGTTYHARLGASLSGVVVYSQDVVFTTASLPTPASSGELSAAVQSLTASVRGMTVGTTSTPQSNTALAQQIAASGHASADSSDFAVVLVNQLLDNGICARRRDMVLEGYDSLAVAEYYDPLAAKWSVADAAFGVVYFDPTLQVGQSVEDLSAAVLAENFSAVKTQFVTSQGDYWFRDYYLDPLTLYLNPFGPTSDKYGVLANDPRPFLTSHNSVDVLGVPGWYLFEFVSPTDSLTVAGGASVLTSAPRAPTLWGNALKVNNGWSFTSAPANFNVFTYPLFWTETSWLVNPPDGGSIAPTSPTLFQWKDVANANGYQLQLGSSFGASDLYDSGTVSGNSVSIQLSSAKTYYARLCTHATSSNCSDSSFATKPLPAQLITPLGDATLDPFAVLFSWNTVAGAQGYSLYIGSSLGAQDVYHGSLGTATSLSVNLQSSTTYYARLWTYGNSQWAYSDTTFQTSAGEANLITPASGAANIDPNQVQFSWTTAVSATAYTLWLGTTPGGSDVYDRNQGLATSVALNLQPSSTYYARIWTQEGSTWIHKDTSFQTGAGEAHLITPADGAVNIDPNQVQFTWTTAATPTSYALWVGTTPGNKDIYNQNQGLATSVAVNLQPSTTYYVRMWTQEGSNWIHKDTSFQTSAGEATLITPASSAINIDPNQVQFTWTTAASATSYALWLGTTLGGNDVYNKNQGLGTSVAVDLQPSATYYARMWTQKGSTWIYRDTTFQTTAGEASLIRPASGAVNIDPNHVQFTWTTAASVTSYALWVGTTPGSKDIYNQNQGLATSVALNLQPSTTYYVRMWTQEGSNWIHKDTSFQTSAGEANLITPASGAGNVDPNQVQFTWTTAASATSYTLWLGTTPGGSDVYDRNQGLATSVAVNLQPSMTYYARMWTQKSSTWFYKDTSFQTSAGEANLITPANGAVNLDPHQVQFTWTTAASVTSYALWVGTTPGAKDIYNQNQGLATGLALNLQPSTTYYVRIWTQEGSNWIHKDTSFQTSAGEANLLTPASGAINIDPNQVQFTWTTGASATSYALWLGSTPGASDVYDKNQGLGTSVTVKLQPSTTYYARIWTQQSSGWIHRDSTFQTSSGEANLITPANGAVNVDPYQVHFSWTTVTSPTSYALWIGTTPGGTNIYDLNQGLATSMALNLQPSTTYYVRMWTQEGSNWIYKDTSFQTSAGEANLITPASGAVNINSNQVQFTWTTTPSATSYTVWIGTTPGGNNVYNRNQGLGTSVAVNLQPSTTYYVRMWTLEGATWIHKDTTFQTQ